MAIEFRKYVVAPPRQVKAVKWTNRQSLLWRSSTRAINGFLQNVDFDFIVWYVGRRACNMSMSSVCAREYLHIIILLFKIRNRKWDVIKRKHFTADDIAWWMWIHTFRGEAEIIIYYTTVIGMLSGNTRERCTSYACSYTVISFSYNLIHKSQRSKWIYSHKIICLCDCVRCTH